MRQFKSWIYIFFCRFWLRYENTISYCKDSGWQIDDRLFRLCAKGCCYSLGAKGQYPSLPTKTRWHESNESRPKLHYQFLDIKRCWAIQVHSYEWGGKNDREINPPDSLFRFDHSFLVWCSRYLIFFSITRISFQWLDDTEKTLFIYHSKPRMWM